MKISTSHYRSGMRVGEERAVALIAKAGFDAWDCSLEKMCQYSWSKKTVVPTDHPLAGKDYLSFVRNLKQVGLDNGIFCNQTHAPFPVSCPEIRAHLERAIECTAELGAEICVIHPDNDKTAQENAEMYFELLPFAKACNVKIATENMWNWDREKNRACFAACATAESFCEHIDVVGSEYLVACLDIGHAEMMGDDVSAGQIARALGHRLQALHIHDNDRIHDNHAVPFTVNIDFNDVTKALKEIGYQGIYTLEVGDAFRDSEPEHVLEDLKQHAAAARRFVEMCK